MKKIRLNPYDIDLWVAKNAEEARRLWKRETGEELRTAGNQGMTMVMGARGTRERTYLIFANNKVTLVHELGHVILDVFDHIGADPRSGNGEAFCYLLDYAFGQVTKR